VEHSWVLAVNHLEARGFAEPAKAKVLVATGCYVSGRWPASTAGVLAERLNGPGQPAAVADIAADPNAFCSIVALPYTTDYAGDYDAALVDMLPSAEGSLSHHEKACLLRLEETLAADDTAVLLFEYVRAQDMLGLRRAFLREMRKLCSQHDVLLIGDEVMTNLRCGMPLIHQYLGDC